MIRLLASADVGQQAEELDRVDQLAAGFHATLEAERNHTAVAAGQVLAGELMGRVRRQPG